MNMQDLFTGISEISDQKPPRKNHEFPECDDYSLNFLDEDQSEDESDEEQQNLRQTRFPNRFLKPQIF